VIRALILVLVVHVVITHMHAAQVQDTRSNLKSDSIIALNPASQSTLNFRPLLAATFEPRVGFQYQLGPRRIRLDIGYSADVWGNGEFEREQGEFSTRSESVTIGVDAFTYTRLRSETNLKFPVETVDYLFGINSTARRIYAEGRSLSVRVRLSHISAHLADGYADSNGILLQRPFVYSREYFDAIVAHEWTTPNIRIYGGGTVLLQVKQLPLPVGRIIPQVGVESCSDRSETVFAAYDLRIIRIDSTTQPVHSVQVGITMLHHHHVKLVLTGYYYAGYSMHGMFFNQRDEYTALGMQVLF